MWCVSVYMNVWCVNVCCVCGMRCGVCFSACVVHDVSECMCVCMFSVCIVCMWCGRLHTYREMGGVEEEHVQHNVNCPARIYYRQLYKYRPENKYKVFQKIFHNLS